MKFLLDTHSFLWFLSGNPSLSERVRLTIEDPEQEIRVSVASLWEIAIKHSLGKLKLGKPFAELISSELTDNSMELLEIRLEHLAVVSGLPFYHRDPFDRLLVAQALSESIPLLSADEALDVYGIERVW